MAINFSDNLQVNTSLHVDNKWGPHEGSDETTALATANTAIPSGLRFEGLTVGIKIGSDDVVEYWYQGGTTDSDLVLKTTSGGGTVSLAANAGLNFDANSDLETLYNTTIDDALTVPTTVGGITAGTLASELKTKSLVQIIDDLLFPTVLPTYVIPTNVINISNLGSTLKEVGSTFSGDVVQTADSNDAGAFTELRIYRDGVLVDTDSNPTLGGGVYSNTFTESNYTVPAPTNSDDASAIVYTAQGDYDAGTAKVDNKGVTDTRTAEVRQTDAPQAADTGFTSASKTIEGRYPYFYGTASDRSTIDTPAKIAALIANGSGNKVLANPNGTLTVSVGTSSTHVWLAVPSDTPLKSEWYETVTNFGPIASIGTTPTTGGDLFVPYASENVNSPDSYWSSIGYTMYIQKPSSSGQGTVFTTGSLQFRV